MIMIFSGNGKGKTTAAFGIILRALANYKTVFLVQFYKTGDSSEVHFLRRLINKKLAKLIKIKTFGTKEFINPKRLKIKDYNITKNAIKYIYKSIELNPFLLVLDEILIALKFKLITQEEILKIISLCKECKINLILTGRGATKKLINYSDLTTNMRKIKHPYDSGIKAIKGIDY